MHIGQFDDNLNVVQALAVDRFPSREQNRQRYQSTGTGYRALAPRTLVAPILVRDHQVTWRSRFHHLKHPKKRPPVKQPRNYFKVSSWPSFSRVFLIIAIRKLSTEEFLAVGPARALYRRKRLRAVKLYQRRFGDAPAIKTYSAHHAPMG